MATQSSAVSSAILPEARIGYNTLQQANQAIGATGGSTSNLLAAASNSLTGSANLSDWLNMLL